jgi:hypothetical protein
LWNAYYQSMWKPGASKPSPSPFAALAEASSSSSAAATRHPAGRGGTSRARAAPEADEREPKAESPGSAAKSPSEPLRTKALSGATLNMRFMKRGAAEPAATAPAAGPSSNRASPQRPTDSAGRRTFASPSRRQPSTGTPKSAVASLRFLQDDDLSPRRGGPPVEDRNDDVEMTDAMEDHEMEDGESDQEGGISSTTPQHRLQHRDMRAFVMEEATPADMHGGRGNLLGRRSFGKFNASAEANWRAALRHAGGGDGDDNKDNDANGGSRRRKKQQQLRGRSPEERPIGNLDSKVSRSHSNNSRGGHSQGKKRKTMISDVS